MSDEIIVVITESIDQLVSIHKEGIERLQELRATLFVDWLKAGNYQRTNQEQSLDFRPRLDRQLFEVRYGDTACVLGNTLEFRLLERLLQRPNIYHTHDNLLSTVWKGVVSVDAIRSVVKTLRAKLRKANLEELADCIDGSKKGHYAIRLPV